MSRLLGIVAAFVMVAIARQLLPDPAATFGTAVMALGFVLIVSFLLGGIIKSWGLPSITGYIAVGMLFGPYLLAWLHPSFAILGDESNSELRLLDSVALGLIAMSAGGELRLSALREHWGRIGGIVGGQLLLVFAGIVTFVLAGRGWFPVLAGWDLRITWAAALLLGVTALSNSPVTALAIIQEYRAKGPVTDVVLAVTVVKDVAVISIFTAILSFASLLTGSAGGFDLGLLGRIAWEVGGSIGAGILLGMLMAHYIKRLGHEVPLLVLGVAFAAVTLLPELHLSGVQTCMVAGFYIENFSSRGEELIKAIERHALPVYVVFFTLAGAGLDLAALKSVWPLAISLAGLRVCLTLIATVLGSVLTGSPPALVRYGWSGFVAQAGVTLGFALLIEQSIPGIGATIKTVVVAVIAINQIVGPLVFRLGLQLAGEVKAGEE